MNRFNAKIFGSTLLTILGLVALLGVFCAGVLGIGLVKAAQTLPKGGDGSETAVELKAGSYEGGSLESKEAGYFYVAGIKPGQEIKVKGTFTAASATTGANCILYLYDENQKELGGTMEAPYEKPETITVSWLPNASKDSYKYFIKAGSDFAKLASHSLEISVTDYYDANSQTDAGDTFEEAMTITPGEYKGYTTGSRHGTDTQDFYKIRVGKGATLTVKATPPSDAYLGLAIYDSNRRELQSELASSAGAILEISSSIEKTEDLFIKVENATASGEASGYTLAISTEGGETVDTGEPTTEGEAAKGPNWVLIGGGILLLVVATIVVILLLKKKQPSQPPQSSQ